MTILELQIKIKALRDELEGRYKLGITKMADEKGKAIPAFALQAELYSLTYKLSKKLE